MTHTIDVAVIQCPLNGSREENLARIEHWVRAAARDGAKLILPPELFQSPYFPQEEHERHFALAEDAVESESIALMERLARELDVAVPVSFFERRGPSYFNSLVMIDAGGARLGVYRKSHIPDGPGYSEKYYFRPGDTGFRVWETRVGRIGVGICWDQWFPEAARAMALMGAELLLYPTAIGSEPAEPDVDTALPWRRAMIGHAVSNAMPLAAANRVGLEDEMAFFYGTSFIADHKGDILAEVGRNAEGVAAYAVDLAEAQRYRDSWGFFRDRRPDLYRVLLTSDGANE